MHNLITIAASNLVFLLSCFFLCAYVVFFPISVHEICILFFHLAYKVLMLLRNFHNHYFKCCKSICVLGDRKSPGGAGRRCAEKEVTGANCQGEAAKCPRGVWTPTVTAEATALSRPVGGTEVRGSSRRPSASQHSETKNSSVRGRRVVRTLGVTGRMGSEKPRVPVPAP